MSAVVTRQLIRDIEQVRLKHPGLWEIRNGDKISALQGMIVIRDEKDIFQGEFEIKILINPHYPNHFPVMYELGKKIERISERHINEKGLTCVEVEPVQWLVSRRGISFLEYIDRYAYRYFCAQIYFETEKKWPGNEWKHEEDGVREYFYELLHTTDDPFVAKVLKLITSNSKPGRNDPCFCGSARKYKNCHSQEIELLKNIPVEVLSGYMKYFE